MSDLGEDGDFDSPWMVAEAPELRKLTVTVRVKPPIPLAERYKTLAKQYRNLRPYLLAHAEEGFGSGFVMIPRDTQDESRAFVVTNQHVVGLAETALVEFEDVVESFPARVAYVDPLYDLAILTLGPNGPPLTVSAAFGLDVTPVKDQDTVIASGYPGIAGKPSYQVTRGYVSNYRLVLDIGGSGRRHIQHTAPIDPGSSGGPLTNEAGAVLGINTLKVRNREGVGLAVPSLAILEALRQVRGQHGDGKPASAQAACDALLAELQRDVGTQAIERGLSAQFVAEHGAESLWILPDDGTNWTARMVDAPEDVLLQALALRLRKAFASDGTESKRCEPDGAASFKVRSGQATNKLSFVLEQARFKLASARLGQNKRGSFLTRRKPAKQKKWRPSLR